MMSSFPSRMLQVQDGRSSAQRFLEEYDQVFLEAVQYRDENVNLRIENANLLSEVNMLREAWERSEANRIRVERLSSALVARLGVIQETITIAAREAIKEGTEETQKRKVPLPQVAPTITRPVAQNEQQADIDDAELRDLVQRLPQVSPMA